MSVNRNVNGTLVKIAGNGGGSGGGLLPYFTVYSDTGSTVTAIKDGVTLTGEETLTSGVFRISNVPEYGEWTVYGVVNQQQMHTTINVNDVKEFVVNFMDGETATPVNDISVLLNCAGYYNSEISTVSELLEDTETLFGVISSNSAIAYLARSTDFVLAFTSDENAMSYIGLNDYASDKLLDVEEWCRGIATSTYFKSVLNVEVPIMTSYTDPKGQVVESSHYSSYYGWYAFCSTSYWYEGQNIQANKYIGYLFEEPVRIVRVDWANDGATYGMKTGYFDSTDDNGNTWQLAHENLITFSTTGNDNTIIVPDVKDNHIGYRMRSVTTFHASALIILRVNFYGRKKIYN